MQRKEEMLCHWEDCDGLGDGEKMLIFCFILFFLSILIYNYLWENAYMRIPMRICALFFIAFFSKIEEKKKKRKNIYISYA